MSQKLVIPQTNFSTGEVDPSAKRREDQPRLRFGARVMRNLRPLNTGALSQRPGRRALFLGTGTRTEQFRIANGLDYLLHFSAGEVAIFSLSGVLLVSNTGYPWTNANVGQIVWCIAANQIVICFPGMQPQIILYTPSNASWSFSSFSFSTLQSQVQEPFLRRSVLGATMLASAQTGSITLTCSVPYFTNSMIGSRISFLGQQVTITAVGSTVPITTATATVANKLPDSIVWTLAAPLGAGNPTAPFGLNQVVEGAQTQRKGEVTAVDTVATTVTAVLMDSISYYGTNGALTDESLVSVLGEQAVTKSTPQTGAVGPTLQWQEEFMGPVQGWPESCFFDGERLGFCAFPQVPEAILWSAIGVFDDFWVDSCATQSGSAAAGAAPTAAILEFMSAKPRVQFVIGEWGSEFVFTDKGVYQIPLSVSQPLMPGGVEFILISDDSCAPIAPALTREAIVFISGGLNRVGAVIRTGSLTMPFAVQEVTEFHRHLLTGPVSIAVSVGDGEFPERYVYVCNADGSVAIGKFTQDRQFVGWVPWSCTGTDVNNNPTKYGTPTWVSSFGANVLYTTLYNGLYVIEMEDDTQYLDCSVLINNIPANMQKAGKGPMWMFESMNVRIMDGAIDYGWRLTDANGNILKKPDDDFSSATLVAGQPWTETLQPFAPMAPGGPDQKQRQRRRRISRATAAVQNSTGFLWGGLEIPPYFFGDDPTQQPPLREDEYACRLLGRFYDPIVQLVKDMPGPITILEVSMEITI